MTNASGDSPSLVSEAMRSAIGGEIQRRVSYPVAASDIRRWAIAVHYPEEPPAEFWDEELVGPGGPLAPEEFNAFAWMSREPRGIPGEDRLDADWTESQLGVPGPGLLNQLNGGVETEYHRRLRVGDVVTSVQRLESYSERESRFGPMLFTVIADTWTVGAGELVKVERMTLIRY